MNLSTKSIEHPDGNVSIIVKTDSTECVWITGSPEGVKPAVAEITHLIRLNNTFNLYTKLRASKQEPMIDG